jgi:hypothetical protein
VGGQQVGLFEEAFFGQLGNSRTSNPSDASNTSLRVTLQEELLNLGVFGRSLGCSITEATVKMAILAVILGQTTIRAVFTQMLTPAFGASLDCH